MGMVDGGPGAPGQMVPVARELSSNRGVNVVWQRA